MVHSDEAVLVITKGTFTLEVLDCPEAAISSLLPSSLGLPPATQVAVLANIDASVSPHWLPQLLAVMASLMKPFLLNLNKALAAVEQQEGAKCAQKRFPWM